MTPPDPRATIFDNLGPRRSPTRNIQTSENAEVSGDMVNQTPSDWTLPPPNWGTVKGFRL